MNQKVFNKSFILNFLPARYMHESWWENLKNGKELQILSRKVEAEAAISKIILEHFDIKDEYHFEFETHLHKISLLSPIDLAKFVMLLGVVTVCDQIKHSIIKKDVVSFKEQLGRDMYDFAVNQATNIHNQVPSLSKNKLDMSKPLHAQVFAYGLVVLGLALKDESRALVTRLVLKLGKPSFAYLSDRNQMAAYKKSDCIELIQLVADHFDQKSTTAESEKESDFDQGVINEEDN